MLSVTWKVPASKVGTSAGGVGWGQGSWNKAEEGRKKKAGKGFACAVINLSRARAKDPQAEKFWEGRVKPRM